jgi:hypothetical protein
METFETKAYKIFIKLYSLFKSERSSTNIKSKLHKHLIRSAMTHACPAWEFAAEAHILKLQSLQNRVLRNNGKFLRRTLVCDLHVPFQIPYMYDYITKYTGNKH